jgi:hypothetical protein
LISFTCTLHSTGEESSFSRGGKQGRKAGKQGRKAGEGDEQGGEQPTGEENSPAGEQGGEQPAGEQQEGMSAGGGAISVTVWEGDRAAAQRVLILPRARAKNWRALACAPACAPA